MAKSLDARLAALEAGSFDPKDVIDVIFLVALSPNGETREVDSSSTGVRRCADESQEAFIERVRVAVLAEHRGLRIPIASLHSTLGVSMSSRAVRLTALEAIGPTD